MCRRPCPLSPFHLAVLRDLEQLLLDFAEHARERPIAPRRFR